ncbi:MAG: response regulator transcription factor [Synechococcales bacterium]|nr:response regulator transcription factor [Synechococcales bacterium]
MRILLIEDDERIVDALAEELTDQHYVVETALDGTEGWELIEAFPYDLILLDIMLPGISGIQLCQKLRSAHHTTPVLMLTARDTIDDRVIGLDAGADDYLVKPFDLKELSARIRALLRRGAAVTPPVLTWEDLTLDPSTCEVIYRGQPLMLSPKEYSLLEFFLRHNRQVFSRAQLLEGLWAFEHLPEEATVKAHIRSLRQKLKAAGVPDLIETVYGLGYRLRPDPHAPAPVV